MEKIKLLYVDLFCGAGGTSTGVESARHNGKKCAKVIACVNHDANAIASHTANHPDARHFTEDIRTLELSPLVAHVEKMRSAYSGALVVLWASLECTNFSAAKGGKPRDVNSRTLGLHLFRYIEALNPEYVQIENVEGFMTRSWTKSDSRGIALKDSTDYYRWVNRIKAYGFSYAHRFLNAADYGAYTSRKRFFGIFAKANLPIIFPQLTHTKKNHKNLFGGLERWKPVKEVLDLSDEGTSIFREKPLADKTLARIYAGLIMFVAGGKKAFLERCNSLSAKGRDVPLSLSLVQTKFIGKYYGQPNHAANVVSICVPAPTLTTKDRLSLVSLQFIVNEYSGGGQHSSIDDVCPAVLTVPKQKVVTYLMNPQFDSAGSSIDNTCFTLIARMDKMPPYLVTTKGGAVAIEVYESDSKQMCLIKEFMAMYNIVDIKMRMLKISELKRIMGFSADYTLIGTQAEQKKYLGNAVEVNLSRVMCEALVKEFYSMRAK